MIVIWANRSIKTEICLSETRSAVNRVWTGLGLNPLLGDKRLKTAHLNLDTAFLPDGGTVYYTTFQFVAHREHSPCPLQGNYFNAI